jgi:hypothetical protein
MPFVENFDEFRARQCCEFVPHNSLWVFENGAVSDGQLRHENPPDNKVERLGRQLLFFKTKLQRTEGEFRDLQSYISTQTEFARFRAGPPPDEAAFTDLETLQKRVLSLRAEIQSRVDELKAIRGQSPAERHVIAYEQRQHDAEAARNRLAAIRI